MASVTAERVKAGQQEEALAAQVEQATREIELQDPDAGASRFDRIVNRTAEMFGVLLLALLTGLVFLNATARYLFSHSFIWGDELIIAIIPWVAMSGLFLAVRRRNVIRIDFFVDKFWPRPRKVLRLAGELLSAIMFVYLAWVSVEYVQSVRRRPVGLSAMADGPVQLFLRDRAAACRVGLSRHVLARSAGRRRSCARPRGPRPMIGALVSIVLLLGLLVLGVPMLVALLAAVVLNFFLSGLWPLTLPQTMISGVSSFTLIALPLFVLAGTIMNAGGISGRLFEFARALVGWLRGGLAQVDVLTSIFFGGMIGSSTADLAGTGSITIPALKREGYPAEIAASVTASSSGIGPLIPPSSPMILYSAITGVSLGSLFLAGLVPGILLGLVLMARRRDSRPSPRLAAPRPLFAARDLEDGAALAAVLRHARCSSSAASCSACSRRPKAPRSASSTPSSCPASSIARCVRPTCCGCSAMPCR